MGSSPIWGFRALNTPYSGWIQQRPAHRRGSELININNELNLSPAPSGNSPGTLGSRGNLSQLCLRLFLSPGTGLSWGSEPARRRFRAPVHLPPSATPLWVVHYPSLAETPGANPTLNQRNLSPARAHSLPLCAAESPPPGSSHPAEIPGAGKLNASSASRGFKTTTKGLKPSIF